jgi:hypothetical protein
VLCCEWHDYLFLTVSTVYEPRCQHVYTYSSLGIACAPHCEVQDTAYRCGADCTPSFVEADEPTDEELHTLLHSVIVRLMKMLTRRGVKKKSPERTQSATIAAVAHSNTVVVDAEGGLAPA